MNVKVHSSRIIESTSHSEEQPPAPEMETGKPNSSSSNPRKLWWQKSVVRRSLSSIEPNIDQVIGSSPFLQEHASDQKCSKGIALFHRSEIQTGRVLGTGGFSLVSEVTAFLLDPSITARCSPEEQALRERYVQGATTGRMGLGRYCIKHLQQRLLQSPKDFQVAASDLAVEGSYLSALDHPNILSVRGLPIDGLHAWKDGQHDGYFIIADRLQDTLEQRITQWNCAPQESPSLEVKAEYAKQLADALQYLHKRRIVYRDTKPQNIGFSVADGRIQLFDFGLCRELPPEPEASGQETFVMSGVGTRRYMAPEILLTGEYNLKADVYSWALLFWEMLSLSKPYALLSEKDHQVQVCRGKLRPPMDDCWPLWIRKLLRQSWRADVNERINMHQLWILIQAKLVLGRDRDNDWLESAAASVDSTSEHQSDEDKLGKTRNTAEQMPISPNCVSEFRLEGQVVPGAIDFESLDDVPAVDCCFGVKEEDDGLGSPPTTLYLQMKHEEQAFCSTVSEDYGSVGNHMLSSDSCGCASPPPAPKKPIAYLNLPQHVLHSISLQRNLSDEDEISGIYSYDAEDSFACHSTDSVDCELW